MIGFTIAPEAIGFGLIVGATYGILAVGLVLIYRVNRIINFAHGEIGAFGASLLGVAVNTWNVPYWLMVPVAMALSSMVGGLVETGVIRRLRNAPRLMGVIATMGFAQFLTAFSLAIGGQSRTGLLYPEPPGLPAFRIGHLLVTPAHTAMLVLAPIVAIALALFLRFTRYGIAMRAAAANPDSARLDGVSASRMSTLAWMMAGAIACLTAILILPTQAYSGDSFGPNLMLSALAAAVLARMSNLVVAFVAGVGVGVVEQVIFFNDPQGGTVQAVLFVIILASLLVTRPVGGRLEEKGSVWATLQSWRSLPSAYRELFLVRHGAKLLGLIAIGLALLIPVVSSSGNTSAVATILALSIVGLSLGVITGLGGQLSFGQFAVAGIGAAFAVHIAQATGNYILAVLAGGVAGAVASVIVGIPALRIRGIMLAVTTLSLALTVESWLLQQPWALGEGVDPGHPVIGTAVLDTGKSYYFFVLVFVILATWVARNIRNGGMGRILRAVRDNEDAARAFAISASGRKLQAFVLAGLIAGIGGAVYAFGAGRISFQTFPASLSISIVAMCVIGGLGLLIGPLLGALYIFGIPDFLPLNSAALAAQAAGWLLLVLYLPSGLGSLLRPMRDRAAALLARRAGISVPPDADDEDTAADALSPFGPASLTPLARVETNGASAHEPLLEARSLSKAYGGVIAVKDISLRVMPGETLGLIGPNGAGKTTLFELLSGFTRPDSGDVLFDGRRINRLNPEQRAHLGLIRSFQDAGLFPTLTVDEVLMLALERRNPTTLFASMVGSHENERPKRERARELVAMMGLTPHRHKPISALSTGTRRVVELCCMIALSPKLLLLDEPSSGIAQRETEALGQLLGRVKRHLGATLVIIEHDIPLIMSLASRIVAMDTGSLIADGAPETIRSNEVVIASYLGGDLTAIERSGPAAPLGEPAGSVR